MARIASIVYRPEGAEQPADRFLREPLAEARLVAGHGIEGDACGGRGERQLNVMSLQSARVLERVGFGIAPGALGEQIMLDGLAVENLPEGARLRMGSEAVIELGALRSGCARFEACQGRPRAEAAGRLGRMARVIDGGVIRPGDSVVLVAG